MTDPVNRCGSWPFALPVSYWANAACEPHDAMYQNHHDGKGDKTLTLELADHWFEKNLMSLAGDDIFRIGQAEIMLFFVNTVGEFYWDKRWPIWSTIFDPKKKLAFNINGELTIMTA